MRSLPSARILVVMTLVAGLFVGCGHAPTAPQMGASASGASSPMTVARAPQPEDLSLLSGAGSLVGGVVNLLVRTLQLVGSLGGVLSNGRWTVSIPANAVDGNATVSLGVTSTTASDCQLGIAPLSLNHFSTPVTLTVDCRGVSNDVLPGYVIRWLDPSTGRWVAVAGSKVDLTAKTVSAPLQHFSQYSVGPDPDGGKAGW